MNKLPKQVYTKAFCDSAVKLVVKYRRRLDGYRCHRTLAN